MSDDDSEAGDPGGDDGTADELADAGLVARVVAADGRLAGDVEAAPFDESTAPESTAAVEELEAELDARQERIAELEAQLGDRDERIEELESRLKRTQADFQNYKKRRKRKEEELRERATEDLIERLIDVRDDLVRALEDESGDAEALREGVELTLSEFDRVLDEEGVEEIAPEPGAEVDPQRHEVMIRTDSDQPEGTVAELYQPGYEMGEKVLRAARVTVSDGPDEGPAADEDADPEADGTEDAAEAASEDG